MNQIDDADLGAKLLPAVDLTLWLQIIVAVLFVLVAGGLALTLL